MKIGYARVSTEEQNEARQITAFEQCGVERIYMDKLSGKDTNRPELNALLEHVIREGDVFIVESISRAARNTADLLRIVEKITAKGAEFVSLKESIDTSTPQGKFMLTVFAAMAELERECILQRQREGIAEAQKAGKYKGRAPIKVDMKLFRDECIKWEAKQQTARTTMQNLGLKPETFYRRVRALKASGEWDAMMKTE